MTDQELINELQQLTEDLSWMSESDYPFVTFVWEQIEPDFQPQDLLHHVGYVSNTPIEVQSVEEFFTPAMTEQDWHSGSEQAEAKRYQQLVNCLRSHLEDVQVYKVGKVEIDVYVLGKTSESNIAGVKTKVVET